MSTEMCTNMKALTLTQPWASLMTLREKRIETRSWYTTYRGELVIHAAKGFPRWAKDLCYEPLFAVSLHGLTPQTLPLSRGLCVVRLLACIPTEQLHKVEEALREKLSVKEIEFGDYSEGRFAWVTEYVRPLEADAPPFHSLPMKGALGLWNWSAA